MTTSQSKPAIASYSIWQALLLGLGLSVLFAFFVWLFRGFLVPVDDRAIWPLSPWDVYLGMAFLPLSLYSYWAWRPHRKHGIWHRWMAQFIETFYLSFLLLLGGLVDWRTQLSSPWYWLVSGFIVVLFAVAWILPVVSSAFAKRIQSMQYTLDSKLLKFGGPVVLLGLAGILGAHFGQHGSETAKLLVAFLMTLIALGFAQHAAVDLWTHYPRGNVYR